MRSNRRLDTELLRRPGLLAASMLALAAASPAPTQSAADRPATTFIHAGRVLDRPGNAPRGPTTIVVRDGRIAEVRDGFLAPDGARLIDLKDRFVLPGFIDVHVHLASGAQHALPRLIAYEAAWNAQRTLLAGFTTVRNVGDAEGTTLALREAINRGWATGPRILDAGRAITTTLGHGDRRVGMPEDLHAAVDTGNICDGADECRKAARLQIGRGVDVIKIITNGLASNPVGPDLGAQMTREEARAIVDVARQFRRKVAAHAHGGAGLAAALEAGVHSIEHGVLFSDADIELLKKSGAYYVPTLSTVTNFQDQLANPALSPQMRAVVEARLAVQGKSLEKAARAGVRIALGTDAGFSKQAQNALEFELLVRHGLTPMQAIVAGTTNAADLLGLSAEIGSIEPGKTADIVAVDADPLRDVTVLKAVGFVMRAGVVYKTP